MSLSWSLAAYSIQMFDEYNSNWTYCFYFPTSPHVHLLPQLMFVNLPSMPELQDSLCLCLVPLLWRLTVIKRFLAVYSQTQSFPFSWPFPCFYWSRVISKSRHSDNLLLFSCSVMSDSCDPTAIVCQAPLSMEFSRRQYWSGLPFPPPGDLLDPGIEPTPPEFLGLRVSENK